MPDARSAADQPPAPRHAVRGRLETRLAAGSLASFVSLLVGIATAIVQVPLLLDAWGEESYGAWLLVVATYSLIISLDLGHQNYVANKISMVGLHSVASCKRVLGSAVKAACIIGLAEVAVAIAVVWSGLFSVWLPEDQATFHGVRAQAGISLILQTLFFAFAGSIGGIVVRLYMAGGLYARSQWIGVAQRLAMFVGLVGAAAAGFTMAEATFMHVACGSLVCAYTFYDVRNKFPAYWPWWHGGSLQTGVRQAALSLGLTATSVSDQCAAAGLLGISASRIHAAGVATLGTLRTLANSILQAAGVLVLPVVPDLSRFAAATDHDKAAATLAVLWLIGTSPLCIGVTLFRPIAGEFFDWWTRGALSFSSSLFSLLAVAALIRQWQTPMSLLLFSANRLRPQVVVSATRTLALLAALVAGFAIRSGLSVAGVAAVISEVAGATAAAVCCALFFHEMGGRLPKLAAALASLQIVVTAGAALAVPTEQRSVVPTISVCLGLHALIAAAQWVVLPAEVKARVRSLWGGYRARNMNAITHTDALVTSESNVRRG